MQTTSRAEAERLLGISEKLLEGKDLTAARDFALLAQETEPLLEGSDQILAVADVLLAAEKRINNHTDWYAVLQLESRRNDDAELIKRQYRRLALLLHPDKNKFPLGDAAFKLVADAWAVLSDPQRKIPYDNEVFAFSKVDLASMMREKENQSQNQQNSRDKIPVRRNSADGGAAESRPPPNLWTACPYCYNLYEYPRVYDGCVLRCMNCQRAFEVVEIPPTAMPPTVPGKDAYYFPWGSFPMGFAMSNAATGNSATVPNWMPPMFPTKGARWPSADSFANGTGAAHAQTGEGFAAVTPLAQRNPTPPAAGSTGAKKRGRPRKLSRP